MQEDSPSSNRKGSHRLFIVGCDIGQCQVPIHGQTLLLGMAAEELQFRANETFLGQKRDDLMPEEMRIHPFLNPRGQGVFMNNLADTAGGVRPETVGLEEVYRPARLRPLD